MEISNLPGGALRITLANTIQYVIMAIFYIIVTKTNVLTQTDIGTLSILNFLALTFSTLTLIALPTALTKFASEKLGKNQKEDATATQRTVTKLVVFFSIAGFAVGVLTSQLISQQLWNNNEYIILIILNFTFAVFTNIKNLCNSIFQALNLFGKMATITIIFILSSRVTAILLAFLNMGVTGVTLGYIVGSIIALTVAVNFLRGKLPKTTKSMHLKPLLSYSFPLFLTSLTSFILNWADIVIITSLTGDLSITGIYSITISSVATFHLLYTPMLTTIFPTLSARNGLKKPESISSILKITSRYMIYLLIPGCIFLAIMAPTALTLFYGPSYARGATPLAILSIAVIITAIFALFETTLKAIGKTGQVLKINIVGAISIILTLVPLVLLLEITGAALAHLITKIIIITLAIYILKKEIKIRLDKEAIWKSAASTTAIIPFLLIIELTLSTKLSTIQTLLLEIILATGIYTLSLYALRALKKQDFQLLKQAFPKPLTKYINIIERIMVR